MAARAGRLHPLARPERHGVEVTRDLAYVPGGTVEHRLDVYRPIAPSGPRPIVLYVHGGGFRILSKDTHWIMALGFARRGYVVVNISYRLAPRHPFPAAVSDVCAAYEWVVARAHEHGGDPSRIILAGESAGANLVTGLAVAAAYRREEPFARAVFDTGVAPSAVMPACGILQVSDVERFSRRRRLSPWLQDRLSEVSDAYLGGADLATPGALDLADPLHVLERGAPPDRALPPFFVPVGTRDILLDDTRRLKAALDHLGVECEARYYEGELHAFHAMVFRRAARRCWSDMFRFLDRHVPRNPEDVKT
jgi:acetyl esterase